MEKKTLIKRTTCPTSNDLWYVRQKYGGYSPCISGSPLLFTGSVLANCVGYCYGRVWEACGYEVPIGCRPGNDFPGDAENWVEYSRQQGLEIGSEPKLGAVACWIHNSKKWGHIAFIEEKYADSSWLSSESGYDSYYFRNTKYPASGYKANYQFLGYIYPPVEFITEPVEHKTLDELAHEVIEGKWGNGKERVERLDAAYERGEIDYNYDQVQERVNELLADELEVGDKVEIVGTGNGQANGKGKTAYGIGWTREILGIYDGEFPYRVGSGRGTTGFYKKEALKKL